MAALISDLGVALCSLSTARGFAATAVLTLGLGIALSTFVGKEGVRPEIWSHGHRNVEAAALHPGTGELWEVEHGTRGGDELNVARKGKDYVVGEERLLQDLLPQLERIRDVRQGPDGAIYVLTNSPKGRILKLVPKA